MKEAQVAQIAKELVLGRIESLLNDRMVQGESLENLLILAPDSEYEDSLFEVLESQLVYLYNVVQNARTVTMED